MADLRTPGAVAALLLAGGAWFAPVGTAAEFAVTGTASVQGSPMLAADTRGGRFLVTWNDDRNRASGLDIYGRILGADGTPTSPEFAIVEAARGQAFAAPAFDPTRNRFLVVWTDWRNAQTVESDIYGRFVSAQGTPEGDEFPIAQERVSQKFPAVALDPVRGQFLVVWTEQGHIADRIRGRRVASDGNPVGPAFTLADTGGDQLRPSVVFDPNGDRFLVIWWDSDDATTSASLVDAGADEAEPRVVLADNGDPQPAPLLAAAYAPQDDVFLVAWSVKDVPPEHGADIAAALFDGATVGFGGRALAIAGGPASQQAATVAYDSSRRRFLVVWYERRPNPETPDMRILGRYVSIRGDLSDAFAISEPQASGLRRSPVPAFNPASDSFLVVWEDGRGGDRRTRRIFGAIP